MYKASDELVIEVIKYLKSSDGYYKDLSYKKEEQTKNEIYGDDFKAEIKLSDYIDLKIK